MQQAKATGKDRYKLTVGKIFISVCSYAAEGICIRPRAGDFIEFYLKVPFDIKGSVY